nr:retrovirus-related Pol polyprotein from transposon TNT 1-94 [Tanacetum cinerariifolium]
QIAQPGMNMGQDRQMQMVGGNGGNRFRQYVGQNVGNLNGYNDVQNVRIQNPNGNGNLVAARADGNVTGHNGIQLQAEEFVLMATAADFDEIEVVNANCILMPNLQQALTSSTQTDKAPVYDSDGSAEYTELLEPIPELITELARYKNQERCFQISQDNYDKLERCYQKSVYQEQYLSKKINALHLSSGKQIMTLNEEILDLNKQLLVEKSNVSSLLEEKKKLKSDSKIYEDELLDKQIQLEKKIKELDNSLVKTGQSIQTIHMLSPKPDSFYHTEQKMALGYQNPFYLKQAQKKQQSLYDGKVLFEKHDPLVVHDSKETLQLAQQCRQKMKQLNKEIKPANYTKMNHLSGVFVSQMAKSREELYFLNTSKTANISKTISIPNEEFSDDTTPSVVRKFLNEVKSTIVPLQRVVKQRMTLDTHNWSSSAHQELYKIVKDEIFLIVNQVDARVQNFEIQFLKEAAKFVGEFKSLAKEADESLAKHNALELEIEHLLRAVENEYAKLWNDWYKKCEECKFDKISYDKAYNDMQQKIEWLQAHLGELKGKRVDNTKTRRPQPRSNTKTDKFPLNKKHMSSECNNVKLATQNVKSKVVCSMCKQCLISVNHDECLLNYVNGMTSRGKKQKANVSIQKNQMKQKPKVKKPKKLGSIKRLALPKPSKPRSLFRWSLTGRMFELKGKIIASSESESQFDCSKGDNACTSNPLEPTIKRFPNSTFSLAGQFCDSDLEVSFRRNACFVRNLEGGDLLSGNRTTNLYTINLYEMSSASPIYLMARASSTKSWLWHQRLSHLNFDTINDLAKNDLVSSLPKFKYHKEHLCPSCEKGKSKRASHPPKPVPDSRQRLHILHMDLCGPMRIASINGKRVFNRRTKKIMETMNVSFDELSAMAFEQRSSKPELQSMTSGQISSGLDLPYASSTITTQQPTEGELDLLFEAMYDDYIGGQPSSAPRTVVAAQAHQQQEYQAPIQPKTVADNVSNAMFDANTFVNPFATPSTREPSQPVLTRNQLRSDGDMCMYALTVSNIELKNVKESMTDPAWIESMQEELLQFKRLDVWVLVPAPDNITSYFEMVIQKQAW